MTKIKATLVAAALAVSVAVAVPQVAAAQPVQASPVSDILHAAPACGWDLGWFSIWFTGWITGSYRAGCR